MINENRINAIKVPRVDYLGLTIVFAQNRLTKIKTAVIMEVNPFSVCFKENVRVGDVLLSFDGTDVESYETLCQLANCYKSETNATCEEIEIKIHKNAAFDVPGLYDACLNIQCSEICKIIENWKPKIIPRKAFENKPDDLKKPLGKVNESLFYTVDKPLLKSMPSTNIEDEPKKLNISANDEPVKYKFHQKAIPMKNKSDRSPIATLKPSNKTNNRTHVVQPMQPVFVSRKNLYENTKSKPLTESKSLTSLTSISQNYSKRKSSTSSFSSDSSNNSFNDQSDIFIPKIKQNPSVKVQNNAHEEQNLVDHKRLSRSIDWTNDLMGELKLIKKDSTSNILFKKQSNDEKFAVTLRPGKSNFYGLPKPN